MDCGFETKTLEDKLRENAMNLEIEVMKLKKANDALIKENIKLKEELDTVKEAALELRSTDTEIIMKLEEYIKILQNKSNTGGECENSTGRYTNRQKRIFQNKVNHGFNTTNIYQEARYILEEVAELMRAVEKNDRENMIEELADIVIFSYGCAEVARLGDLDTKIFEKMKINEKRVYKKNGNGDFVKTAISHV